MLRRALPRNPMSDPARMIAFECVYPKQMCTTETYKGVTTNSPARLGAMYSFVCRSGGLVAYVCFLIIHFVVVARATTAAVDGH